jgi:O-acetyl-ADP-ribose deacetylase (regulator of RNase III)
MSEETFRRAVGRGSVELVLGNIVEQEVDAIVNAANTKLSGGGGVDGAVHRAAGKDLARECRALPADEKGRRCPTGQVRVTGAGRLKARHVLHAVGPFYNADYAEKASARLREAYDNVLRAAAEHRCRTIAVPAISTGAYRFPLAPAAEIALGAVADFLKDNALPEVVRFVLFKPAHLEAFRAALEGLAG